VISREGWVVVNKKSKIKYEKYKQKNPKIFFGVYIIKPLFLKYKIRY